MCTALTPEDSETPETQMGGGESAVGGAKRRAAPEKRPLGPLSPVPLAQP
jgi:hypothetical protein